MNTSPCSPVNLTSTVPEHMAVIGTTLNLHTQEISLPSDRTKKIVVFSHFLRTDDDDSDAPKPNSYAWLKSLKAYDANGTAFDMLGISLENFDTVISEGGLEGREDEIVNPFPR